MNDLDDLAALHVYAWVDDDNGTSGDFCEECGEREPCTVNALIARLRAAEAVCEAAGIGSVRHHPNDYEMPCPLCAALAAWRADR
jgi:hypothetical protein